MNPSITSRIDRLVDDELSNDERRDLLAALDREPDGWRRCALTFLEAQAWKSAMTHPASPPSAARATEPAPRRTSLHRLTALAAAVIVSFALGAVSSVAWRTGETSPVATGPGAVRQPALSAVATSPEAPLLLSPPARPVLSDYVRQRLERQGYEIEEKSAVVPVALNDGRKVELPVEIVTSRYVGYRIH